MNPRKLQTRAEFSDRVFSDIQTLYGSTETVLAVSISMSAHV